MEDYYKESCKNCINGEKCNLNQYRIHCNIYNKSFDKDAVCEKFEENKKA